MTFTNINSGDPGDPTIVMQNFKHVNYGTNLRPVNSSGADVDDTLDLGSTTAAWRRCYLSQALGVGIAATPAAAIHTLTDDATSSVEVRRTERTTDSPADNDEMYESFYHENDFNEQVEISRFVHVMTDVSDGSEDSEIQVHIMINGTRTKLFTFNQTRTRLHQGNLFIDNSIEGVQSVVRHSTDTLLIEGGNGSSDDYTQDELLTLRASSINPNSGNHGPGAAVAEIQLRHNDESGSDSSGEIDFLTTTSNFSSSPVLRWRLSKDGHWLVGTHNTYDISTSGGRVRTVYCVTLNESSDKRLKKQIKSLTSVLDLIEDLNPVQYKWRAGQGDDNLHFGFAAQDLKTVLENHGYASGTVVENDEETDSYGIRYSEMNALNIAATKELYTLMKKQFQSYEKRIKALEDKLSDKQ